MQGIIKLNITWSDNNHAHVQDPDNGHEFNITVRQMTNRFVGGHAVKPRLYIGGSAVDEHDSDSMKKRIAWAKEHFGPTLQKILNKPVDIRFSSKAGCSCGCSPGFIIEDTSIPFDIWMNAK